MLADLLKEGTTKRDSGALATAAALMGGDISINAGNDETSLSIDVLSEYAPQAIELLAEILTEPALPASELPRIQQNYLRSLSIELKQPQSIADAAFEAMLYPNHPYGRLLPTEAQLTSYTIEDLRSFYSANFGAQRAHVYVAGKFTRGPIEAAIRQHLGEWTRGPAPIANPPPNGGPLQVKLIDRPGAPQSNLRMGLRVIPPTHPDFMALSVTNTLLGGSLTSRITSNLRENKGFAYSPRSTLDPKLGNAAWVEEAEVKSAATGPAISEIFKEINLLKATPPSEAELNAIKNYRNGIFVLGSASRFGLISQFAFMDLHGLSPEWLTTFLERMYAITPEQVSQSARTYIDPAKMSVVVVGDLKTVKKQLKRVPALKSALPK
jgi:predicted Zn-dependent peptidase